MRSLPSFKKNSGRTRACGRASRTWAPRLLRPRGYAERSPCISEDCRDCFHSHMPELTLTTRRPPKIETVEWHRNRQWIDQSIALCVHNVRFTAICTQCAEKTKKYFPGQKGRQLAGKIATCTERAEPPPGTGCGVTGLRTCCHLQKQYIYWSYRTFLAESTLLISGWQYYAPKRRLW